MFPNLGQWLQPRLLGLVLGVGLCLLLMQAGLHGCERRRQATQHRTELSRARLLLIDSVQRAAEARSRRQRDSAEAELRQRLDHHQTRSQELQHRDQALETRYRASRVQLPEW